MNLTVIKRGSLRLQVFKASSAEEAAEYGIKPGRWYARFIMPSAARGETLLQDAVDGAGYTTLKTLIADALADALAEQQSHGDH